MADDTDGVAETFDESLRVALTVTSQLGERVVRLREDVHRRREADDRNDTRELQARFDAERSAARAQLAVVDRPDWWDRATVADITTARDTASAWRNDDDVAARAEHTIRDQLQARYGIDLDRLGADPAAARRELDGADHDRVAAEERRQSADELTVAEAVLAGAEERDRVSHTFDREAWEQNDASNTRQVGYDSRERRAEFARALEGTASEQEIRGRILADLGNARHPRDAVTWPGRRTTPPGRDRAAGGQQRDRGGLTR